ncbi:hypothetical protein [Kitasatospora sp. NPDC057015]|uniref:hypothetical protein n=1 Tax=Kitasatospora sp. NPDC057015 TaxID=3346001 RepID=UPI0036457529
MTDPRTVLGQARQGPVPGDWKVFTKSRGRISGFLHGTSHDPDPLLVITPYGAVEYTDEGKPLAIVNFLDLAGLTLRVTGQSFSDSSMVTLNVWLDLEYHDGRKEKWRSRSFSADMQTIQTFIEAYGVHRALRGS